MNTFKDLLERSVKIKKQVKYSQNDLNEWLEEYITAGVVSFKKDLSKKYSNSEVEYIVSVVKAEDRKVNG